MKFSFVLNILIKIINKNSFLFSLYDKNIEKFINNFYLWKKSRKTTRKFPINIDKKNKWWIKFLLLKASTIVVKYLSNYASISSFYASFHQFDIYKNKNFNMSLTFIISFIFLLNWIYCNIIESLSISYQDKNSEIQFLN